MISKPDADHLSVLNELPASAKLTLGNTLEELQAAVADAEVIVNANFQPQPFRTLLPMAKKLRWVHCLSAGVEAVLSPEMVESPAPLTNARGVFKASLAEFAVGAMIYFAKDLRRMIRSQMAGRWEQFDVEMLEGATLGVIGYGEIGRASAKLAHAFGVKVLALRRRPQLSDQDPILHATYTAGELHQMLQLCDYVILAAPNTPETKGLLDEAAFQHMKPTAVVINVGRGPVVVESALVHALQTGRIRGAALDVFDQEPLPKGHPFYQLENVLLSPHCADHTEGWSLMAMRKFISNYRLFEKGEPLDNIVDKKAGY
jgi:phosphoglycerate dehydrogenase-like enzyme